MRLPLPLVVGLVVPLLAVTPTGCESSPGLDGVVDGSFGGSNSGGTCAIEDESLCGTSCSRTEDCPTGLYCDDGTLTCQAECIAGEEESSDCGGRSCTAHGQCSEGDPHGDVVIGQGGLGGMGGEGNDVCIDVQVDFEPQIPNVVLLIDQSGSMNSGSGFGETVDDAIATGTYEAWDCGDDYDYRWNVVRNVLLHPDTGVVGPLEDRIRFGMSLYTSNGGGETCPILTTVDIGLETRENMLEEFQCSDIKNDTPTRESLTETAEALAAQMLDGPQVIVLATDGAPDNCTCANWDDDTSSDCGPDARDAEQEAVVAEAARIYEELGIVVHVVDVSSPSQTSLHEHLSEVATAGGGEIFDGTDPGGLIDAFSIITSDVQSCAIDLNGSIAPGKEDTGTVTLDGMELELDGPDGWVVNSSTQIELVGEACEATKAGEASLDISFPCGAFIVK